MLANHKHNSALHALQQSKLVHVSHQGLDVYSLCSYENLILVDKIIMLAFAVITKVGSKINLCPDHHNLCIFVIGIPQFQLASLYGWTKFLVRLPMIILLDVAIVRLQVIVPIPKMLSYSVLMVGWNHFCYVLYDNYVVIVTVFCFFLL